jgi:hypothetical protein
MPTFQTQLLNELRAGHDGPPIPESKRVYFQERFRGRVFDFLVGRFIHEQRNGLTKAKLARRIGKSPEVVNRWLGAPSNLTSDSISDLLLGICGEEMVTDAVSLLNRKPVNFVHLDDQLPNKKLKMETTTSTGTHRLPGASVTANQAA